MSGESEELTYLSIEAWQPRMSHETLLAALNLMAEKLGSLFPKVYYEEDRRGPKVVPFTLGAFPEILSRWSPKHLNDIDLFYDNDSSLNVSSIRFSDLGGIYVTHAYEVDLAERVCLQEPVLLDHMDEIAQGLAQMSEPLTVTLSTYLDRMNFRDGKSPKEWKIPAPDYSRLYWRNYWSPQMVQWAGGEDAVLEQTWHSAARLPGGWLKLDTAPSPFEWNRPEYLALRDAVAAKLQLVQLNARINAAMDVHPYKTWPNVVNIPI